MKNIFKNSYYMIKKAWKIEKKVCIGSGIKKLLLDFNKFNSTTCLKCSNIFIGKQL